MTETWPEYVRRIAGRMTQAGIAARTGGNVSPSSVGRWLRGEPGIPDAGSVIAFAVAFDRNPIEALTVAGYLPPAENPQRWVLSDFTTAELLAELSRRSAGW